MHRGEVPEWSTKSPGAILNRDKSAGQPIWTSERSEDARRARCRMHLVNRPEGRQAGRLPLTGLIRQIGVADLDARALRVRPQGEE